MSTTIEDQDWRQRAAALADELARAGVLTDPGWRVAIEQTPRHVFVPRFYDDDDTIIDGANPDTVAAWLTSVYSDDSLVT